MAATNPADVARLRLENIIALVEGADALLFPASTRLAQRALEMEEADLLAVNEARRRLRRAHRQLLGFHPNARILVEDENGRNSG